MQGVSRLEMGFFSSFLFLLLSSPRLFTWKRNGYFLTEHCLGHGRPFRVSSRRVIIARLVMVQVYNGGVQLDANFVLYVVLLPLRLGVALKVEKKVYPNRLRHQPLRRCLTRLGRPSSGRSLSRGWPGVYCWFRRAASPSPVAGRPRELCFRGRRG